LPISEGTCRPFVMASYLSFGPYWPNVSAPLRMGRCLLTALVISKNHPQFHLAPERSAKCDERYIAYDSPMMHFSFVKQIFLGKRYFFLVIQDETLKVIHDSKLHSENGFLHINDACPRFDLHSIIFSLLSFLFIHSHQLSEDIDRLLKAPDVSASARQR
jgi:hypothetical protein